MIRVAAVLRMILTPYIVQSVPEFSPSFPVPEFSPLLLASI
jgi:hypothetical protein